MRITLKRAVFVIFLVLSACPITYAVEEDGKQFAEQISAKNRSVAYLSKFMPRYFGSMHESSYRVADLDQVLENWKTRSNRVAGRIYPNSVSFNFNGRSSYGAGFEIDGFDFFAATVSGNWRDSAFTGPARFVCMVYGDKKLLYTSLPLDSGHPPVTIYVPVKGISTLFIETRSDAHVSPSIWWGDARLIKTSDAAKSTSNAKTNSQERQIGSSPPSNILEIAAMIGGLSLEQLRTLDSLIHKRIQIVESSQK